MKIELPRYQSFQPTGWEWLPELPAEWEGLGLTRRIERIVDYRGATPEKVDDGTFLITAKNVRNGQIDYAISTEYVATEALETIMRRGKPRLGDLLLTMEAPLGEVANIDREDIALAQRLVKIRPKSKFFSPYFLKYWMMSVPFRQHIKTHGTGSIAVGIKASKLHLLRVVQPPRDVQDAIVTFLDRETAKIDRLMAVRQKQVERLQEQRTAVIHHAVTKGLDPHVKLKPSEHPWLEDIPAHWDTYRLKFIAKLNPSKSASGYVATQVDKVVFLPMECVSTDGKVDQSNHERICDLWKGFTYFAKGDVLVAKITPCFENGKGALVSELETDIGFGTTEFHVVRAGKKLVAQFLYQITASYRFRGIGERFMTGAAGQQRVSQQFIADFPIALPPPDEQQAIVDHVRIETGRVDTLIAKYARELELLVEYRASLISHAVTGKIDVRGLVEPSSSESS